MRFHPSPNYNERPAGAKVTCLLIHADASKKVEDTLDWIARRESKVSYHFVVGRTGEVFQCVPTAKRAWHAGVSERLGVPDVNNYSIGIAFSNDQAGEPFDVRALDAGVDLCKELCLQFHCDPRVALDTHANVALPPGRKHDPGPWFDFAGFVERIAHGMGR